MQVDVDMSGHIRYTEFIAASMEKKMYYDKEILLHAFERMDIENTGFITVTNLLEILGGEYSLDEVREMMSEARFSASDRISYQEFLRLMGDEVEGMGMTGLPVIVEEGEFKSEVNLLGLVESTPSGHLASQANGKVAEISSPANGLVRDDSGRISREMSMKETPGSAEEIRNVASTDSEYTFLHYLLSATGSKYSLTNSCFPFFFCT
jgi:hypothetical protein